MKRSGFKMSFQEQLKKIQELYSSNLIEKGVSANAVGWNTPESQELRFAKLSSVIERDTHGISVNDYGCGYGAHLRFLIQQLGVDVNEYNGYDLSPEMLIAAKTHLDFCAGVLNLFQTKDIQTNADYSFVSGTFNVRFETDENTWEVFIKSKLEELNQFSRKGFAFNLLTSYVDWKEPHLYYGDPCFWFDYCKKHFSKRVSLLHDYPLWEWTMIVRAVD